MRLASALIRIASWLVPQDQRNDWRREWLAELEARSPSGPAALRFAIGAPFHATWLRYDAWRPALLVGDVRDGLRQIRRRPGLAAAAILTLAIGAGATTAIFSVVYGVLLKPLPYRDPERLVQLWEVNPLFNWTDAAIAPGNFLSWRERNTVFSETAYYMATASREGGLRSLTLEGQDPVRVQGYPVSGNFFDVLGVRAATGRTFASGEDVVGHNRVLILSDQFWRSTLGADPNVVNRTISLNGIPYTVIGVMAPEFRFDAMTPDFWMPLVLNFQELREVRRPHFLRAVARLKPGVTIERARAELVAIARDLEREHPATNKQMSAGLGPVDDWFVAQSRRPLLLFLAAVGLVLLIGCANVANLMLARALERVGEMSVRSALGASRSRLVRQLLVESLVIAGVGSALGLGLAVLGVRAFVRFAPVSIPRLEDVGLDVSVLVFSLGLTVMTTLLVGLAPAVLGAHANLRDALGSGTRMTSGRARLRRALVSVEVALAVVLLVGATLALRSFSALMNVDPGLPIQEQVSGRIALPGAAYSDSGKAATFFEDAATRLRSLPGVTGAGAVAQLPLEGASWTSQFYIEGRPEFHGYELRHKAVTSGYLEALGVRLISGRTLNAQDRSGTTPAIVANEAFVTKYFPGEDPVGRRVTWDPPGPKILARTIVGVVSDEPQDGLGQAVIPEIYYPILQEERSEMALLVRSTLPPAQVGSEMRRVVREIDPRLAVFDIGPMTERLDRSLAKPRVATWLASGFAVVALLLAVIGIYGVTAWAAAARRREFGIRIACGAARRDVFRLVMRQDLAVVGAGMVVGAVLAGLAARAAGSLLFGVAAGDVMSYAIGLAALLAAGVAACIGPARRAARVDPVAIMRAEA